MTPLKTLAIRRLFRVVNGGTPTPDADNWDGDVPWATPVDLGRVNGGLLSSTDRMLTATGLATGSRAVQAGSLIVSTRAPIGYVVQVEQATAFNQGCRGLEARVPVDVRFFRYQLSASTDSLASLGQGSTFIELSGDQLGSFNVTCPPLDDQRAIADYLDRETARLDALIAAKLRMVDLFQQRLRIAIADRVLGPPVHGASSGPEQVSPRPGWKLIPFRWLFREVDDRSATGAEELLSVSQTRGVIPQSALGDRRQYAETLVGYKVCRPGDLVINRMWVYYGALGASRYHGLVSPDYAVFRPISSVTSEFAAYVLRTEAYVGEMTRLVKGIGAAFQDAVRKPRLHPNELGLIAIPVPPLGQQEGLLDELAGEVGRTEQQSALLRKSADLLRERRQALITAAVTGQVQVAVAA